MKKYLVVGGTVISQKDGQEHYVNARKLCELYQVNPEECILIEETDKMMMTRRGGLASMLILRPRYDGNYNLEELEAAAKRLKEIQKKKLINECQFCKSRFCYHRIVREEEPKYDEVYCNKHIDEAENEADRVLGNPGHMRSHISGTGIQKRGVPLKNKVTIP